MSSKSSSKTAIVFGAGVAGLSAAHYLCNHGFRVIVVETLNMAGGMARSERIPEDNGAPSEYSWRGFGPWYHNVYDVMKQIPLSDGSGTLYDNNFSTHGIGFHLAADREDPQIARNDPGPGFKINIGSYLSKLDRLKIGWLLFRQWTASRERSLATYATQNANQTLHKYLGGRQAELISSIFGPFVGVDASRASTHHIADFFRKNMFPGDPGPYYHPSKDGRKAWVQGSNSGWLILNRPSNEAWFDPWVFDLRRRNVQFHFGSSLAKLNYDGSVIASAELADGTTMSADFYVLAINPFSTRDILNQSPNLLAADAELQKFTPLTAGGPHVQIAFQLVFGKRVILPGKRETAILLYDSEFDITLFSQDQLFNPNVDLGTGVVSIWSGNATIDTVPGRLYGKTICQLTKAEFIEELTDQIFRNKSLNAMIKLANNGRDLSSFDLTRIQVWHGWTFPEVAGAVIKSDLPKWVNTTENTIYQPNTKTSIPNLYLAGAHTKTSADLWSMEAAVESGRRAADLVAGVKATAHHQSDPFEVLKRVDSMLYKAKLPHILDLILSFIIVGVFWVIG